MRSRSKTRPTIGPDRPAPTRLEEIPPRAEDQARYINEVNSYLRIYRYGACGVIVTKEYGKWHISVSRPDRLPSWDEIRDVRYAIAPDDVTMAMILPPKSSYINIHPNCLHLWEMAPSDFEIPPGIVDGRGRPE
jgi:hypothetical protein